jgi:hypothetical protein
MADLYDDDEDAGNDDFASLNESIQGLPDKISRGVVEGLNPPSTPEQINWANDILSDADTLDSEMEDLLSKRSAATSGPQGTLERLRAARERLANQSYDTDNRRMWGAVAAALGQNGSIGEAMGRSAGAINQERTARDKFDQNQQSGLTEYDQAIGEAMTGDYDSQMKALQHRIDARNAERLKALQVLGKGKSANAPGVAPTAARSNVLKMADDWFANQRSGVVLNAKIMDEAAKRAGEAKTGPGYGLISALAKSEHELPAMIGEFMKAVNNPDIKELERDVRSVIFPTVRQVLGAQFTAKENFTLLETAFDPSAPPPVNRRRLELILSGLKDAQHVKDAYFSYAREHGGDMSGYGGPDLTEVERIGDRILEYAASSGAGEGAEQARPAIERKTRPGQPNSTDEFISDPRDRNRIIRNPNFKPQVVPGARVVAPRAGAEAAPAEKPAGLWDNIKRKVGEKFAEGGEVEGDQDTEEVTIGDRTLTVPKGMTDEQIYAFLDAQEAAEKATAAETDANSTEAIAELAVDGTAAAAGYGGANALQRLADAANERSPHEVAWGTEEYGLRPNENYLSPGQRRFADRFATAETPPEQRLDALIERHKELQTQRGLPRATAAEAMTPEQISLVNESIRSPNSSGVGAAELRQNLGENQASMLAGDPMDVDRNGRAMSEGHTLDTLQADLQSNRPYKDVIEELERVRKEAYDPLRQAAYADQWVPVNKFNPELIADTDVGRTAIERAQQSWMNNMDTNGRPMLQGRRINPGNPAVTPSAYDVEFLDSVRRALNDMHVESVQGKGTFNTRDINAWRRRFTDALYGARPDLQAANSEYETRSRPIDAARVGRGDKDASRVLWKDQTGNYKDATSFDNMPTEELRDYLASLDPDSKAALRSGLYENYRNAIQDTSAKRNPIEAIFGSDERPSENMSRLKLLFEDDPEGLQTMLDDIKAHSNSYDIAHSMGAKSESARGRPRGAPVSKAADVGGRTADALTKPARRLMQGPDGDKARKFTTEEIDDIARIASEHRLQSLERLRRAATNRAGRKGRARRAGLLGAGAATLFTLRDKLKQLAEDAFEPDEAK